MKYVKLRTLAFIMTAAFAAGQTFPVRIPTKPARHSELKPATRSELKPAMVPN